MKNMFDIIADDFRRLTSSVVSIVVLLGIVLVPCCFVWFNVLSNWEPFDEKATGRIPVAVVNEDKGAEMMGLYISVGEKMTDELAAKPVIDWHIMKNKERAIEGTRAGDYYAAIVIPEDFSEDVLSVSSGDPVHPVLQYYENDKKNAVAPKITGKVRDVLQEEVNSAFVGTIASFIAEAGKAAESAGLDPRDVFGDLSRQMSDLSGELENSISIVQAASGLSDAANELLKATGGLMSGSEKTLEAGEKLLDASGNALPNKQETNTVTSAVKEEARIITGGLGGLAGDLNRIRSDMDAFNTFVEKDLKAKMELVDEMRKSALAMAKRLREMGLTGLADMFTRLADRLGKIYDELSTLEKADETTWPEIQKILDQLVSDVTGAQSLAEGIGDEANSELDDKVNKALTDARKTIAGVRKALSSMYGDLDTLDAGLAGSEKSLKSLSGGLDGTLQTLLSLQTGLTQLSAVFESLSDSDLLKDVNHLMENDAEVIAARLASPIQMDTVDIYPIRNFGSVMAAFYTAMALWIGALFAAVMISTKVKRREGMVQIRLHERFFGRYRLFFVMGQAQALIIALGDLLYVGIQCQHPFLFILACCVISAAFTLFIYAFAFALDSIGLVLCVVFMIIQIAGAGGLFPIQVVPPVFQALNPFMPLRYAMDALRECIGGMYNGTYIKCLGILILFGAAAAGLGLLLYKPMRRVNEIFEEVKEESGIML
ncbi:MAG: YhgE/Pip domain-containing protein [Firmicutes bacterium]|nr:YhgE/Pip domain-containing protein [Bacillota bacterium]